MTQRKGMGKGKGKGFFNILGIDPKTHSDSAKGIKQPQKIFNRPMRMKDSDGDGVPDHKDCQPFNPKKQDTTFNVAKGITISAKFEKTRSGFRHIAILFKDFREIGRTKVTYQNRTWESYEFETVIRKLLEQTDAVTPAQKERFLKKQSGIETEKVEKMFGTVATVAKMGDVLADTKKEKNDWKKRMLKAGLPELDIPDDWDTLSEDEKEKRLNKVISLFDKKGVKKKDFKDKDGDFVPDEIDCEPDNPDKQDSDEFTDIGEFTGRLSSTTPSKADLPVKEIGEITPDAPSRASRIFEAGRQLGAKGVMAGREFIKTQREERAELEAMTNAQLREKAIAKSGGIFGGNKYERELLRRIQSRKELDKKLKAEEAKESPQSLFG